MANEHEINYSMSPAYGICADCNKQVDSSVLDVYKGRCPSCRAAWEAQYDDLSVPPILCPVQRVWCVIYYGDPARKPVVDVVCKSEEQAIKRCEEIKLSHGGDVSCYHISESYIEEEK